jgi:hypothetical protein
MDQLLVGRRRRTTNPLTSVTWIDSRTGIVDCERRGLWAYYYVKPDALDEFARWIA